MRHSEGEAPAQLLWTAPRHATSLTSEKSHTLESVQSQRSSMAVLLARERPHFPASGRGQVRIVREELASESAEGIPTALRNTSHLGEVPNVFLLVWV